MTTWANRGMQLEEEVESSNLAYWLRGTAVVQKVATPFKPIRDGNGNFRRLIPAKKSTVDFIGCLDGRGLAFDAKETRERNRFPLENVKEHQVQFLEKYRNVGGHAFLLVRFVKHRETFILTADALAKWWDVAIHGGRKSIPHEWFLENCEAVGSRNGIVIDYLHPILAKKVAT
nr:MAG TPA: Holliday junction-specific endonuclease [Caudoviricetes sp.]